MNTITSSVQNLAMDGQALYTPSYNKKGATNYVASSIQTRAEVAQSIEQNLAKTKSNIQEIEKLSEITSGRKLRFSVNKELGSVVVSIVDSTTNKVIKEIPSEDMQKMKIRIRKAIGALYDNLV